MKPPKHLTPAEQKVWKEIIKVLPVPPMSSDRIALEVLVSLLNKQRTLGLESNERTTLVKLLFEFRLTPNSRSKAPMPEIKDNEFDSF